MGWVSTLVVAMQLLFHLCTALYMATLARASGFPFRGAHDLRDGSDALIVHQAWLVLDAILRVWYALIRRVARWNSQ